MKKHILKVKREPIRHPEQREDEVFIGNDNEYSYKQLGWKTKRKGSKAYSLLPFLKSGELIPVKALFPVFVKNEEYKNKFIKEEPLQGKRKT